MAESKWLRSLKSAKLGEIALKQFIKEMPKLKGYKNE